MNITNTKPITFFKCVAIIVGSIVAIVIFLFGGVGVLSHFEVKHLRAFCENVKPEMSLEALRQIAPNYGVNSELSLDHSFKTEKPGGWVIYVPAMSTMGDVTCNIYHNGKTVTQAKMFFETHVLQ